MALKLGYKDIVVAPYFLFSGKLIDRIYNYVDRVALTAPDVNFVKAHYLADQDHVISTFVDRIEEAKIGSLNEDVDLMKSFKERLIKGEVDVHHHHAEYKTIDTNHGNQKLSKGDHEHRHDHGNSHDHGPSPAGYKHIGHPNGPRTMIDQGVCGCFMSQIPHAVVDEQRAILAKASG